MAEKNTIIEKKYLQFFKRKDKNSKRIIRSYKLNKSTIYKLRLIINRIYEKTGESLEMTEIVNKGLDKYLTNICRKLNINI